MKRRDFLKWASVTPLMMIAPDVLAAVAQPALGSVAAGRPGTAHWDRVLVLIDLKGGNDGLNTVVPYGDPAYYQMRPRLGVAREQVLQLADGIGFNPMLEPLMASWQARDLGVVLGVGYPNPNRSHFRSIAIWETGSDSNQYLDDGWVARLFARNAPPRQLAADGIVVGQDGAGPLAGDGMRTLTMQNPEQFVRQAERIPDPTDRTTDPALAHILTVQRNMREASRQIQVSLDRAPGLKTAFPNHRFGQSMETTARLLTSRTPVVVIKVSHTGFDTHANQRGRQDQLLKELAEGLAAFRNEMKAQGMWNRVLITTYSEFGRRASENASAGTDHGTAAPHLIMGGGVKGGLHGAQPSLERLETGDLQYTVDFRSIYATIAQRWWGLGGSGSVLGHDFPVLNCVA